MAGRRCQRRDLILDGKSRAAGSRIQKLEPAVRTGTGRAAGASGPTRPFCAA